MITVVDKIVKICPVARAGGEGRAARCLEQYCGWWVEAENKCAMCVLAEKKGGNNGDACTDQ